MMDDATARQIAAARPASSTWLSANAGSGKTRVLTDRVARLLLERVDPQRILCLTYTKAAASEMQNRLFDRLGAWAMLGDDRLGDALAALGVDAAPDADTLLRARRLFARAIETPGGLRIQTIHSFCAGLLRRFPLEAGVSPQFTEMDDRAASLLRARIIDEMADRLAPDVMTELARARTGEDFQKLAVEVVSHRARFEFPLDEDGARAMFGLAPDLTQDRLLADVFQGGEAEWLAEAGHILAAGSVRDAGAGRKLLALDLSRPGPGALAALEDILLFGLSKVEGKSFTAKLDALATAATRPRLSALQDRLNALSLRVEAARPRRIALQAALRTLVLHRFAAAFLPLYAARKAARGWLDFDDLITCAKALLTDPSVAQWVLYRLDGGIDHILVDEAQDTSPDQWQVIELLAQEFTAGRGASDRPRTIFVVGDKKQSIYSFQGADVGAFDAMKDRFGTRLAAVDTALQDLTLEHSFRSSPLILGLVDRTFAPLAAEGLGGPMRHVAFKDGMAGRVDLWPVEHKSDKDDGANWFDPVDIVTDKHHAARLGTRIARHIRGMINAGTQIPTGHGGRDHRPMHAGDVLILVQRRSEVFAEIIRACKAEGLPIAGADRLKLGGELAVRDLSALLAFLALPEDDLSLAAVLRSPLFGWTEDQLYRLAQPRPGFLWTALRDSDGHPATLAVLNDLRDRADFLRPYELIERMLTRHGGRQALIARLGAEAEDGIDELLSQALAYERTDVPSLTGFLCWLQTEEVEVKRQMDAAGRRIRVMTVHGAKGLEAPVVILPDCADRKPPRGGETLLLDGAVAWPPKADSSPDTLRRAREAWQARAAEENLRLLYVAMTRAQSWLIVAAAGAVDTPRAWYNLVRDGMAASGARPTDDGGLEMACGDWPAPQPAPPQARDDPAPVPGWITGPPPDAPRPARTMSPSGLGGAKALFGDGTDPDEAAAMERGTALHLLLEHLPGQDSARWPVVAAGLLAGRPDAAALLAEAQAVLSSPGLAPLFAADALTEAAVTADLGGQRMLGTIDRLIVTADHVLAIDYKSNVLVPDRPEDVPDGIVRQMAAYDAALALIYPDRQIDVAILWTRTARLMPLPCNMLRSALRQDTLP